MEPNPIPPVTSDRHELTPTPVYLATIATKIETAMVWDWLAGMPSPKPRDVLILPKFSAGRGISHLRSIG